MIERVVYTPEAEQDVAGAYSWYEAREPGLSHHLLTRCCFRVLWISVAFSLCFGCAADRQAGGWRTHNAGTFVFSLPAGMKRTSASGIDSQYAEFARQGIVLSFDYGFYSSNLSDWPPSAEFERATIGGVRARIAVARQSFGHRYPYSVAVSFENKQGDPKGKRLSMFASCGTKRDCALAKRIFYSVRF